MDRDDTPEAEAMAAPATNEAGFAMHGEYPLNSRLRAEALAADGKEEDPDGLVTPELIAETRDRVAAETADREAAERREAKETPSMKWTEAKLREEAARRGVTVESDANKAAILAAIEAAPAAPKTEA